MSFDLKSFSLSDMLRCGLDLRSRTQGTLSMEETADIVVRYLFEHAHERGGEESSCVLVRCYRTCAFSALPPDLQQWATKRLGTTPQRADMRCLTLLASVGIEPEWNSRGSSRGHQAIPLASADMVAKAPMIAELIREFGIDLNSLMQPSPESTRDAGGKTYNVFHVENALGSPHIPAQEDFVVKYGVRSVLGFGGSLRTGDLYAVIMFSRVHVPASSADRFRTVALDVKSAFFRFEEARTFAARG